MYLHRLKEVLATQSVDPELGEAIIHLITLGKCGYTSADSLEQLGAVGEARYIENEGNLGWKWKPETQGYKTIFDILSVRIMGGLLQFISPIPEVNISADQAGFIPGSGSWFDLLYLERAYEVGKTLSNIDVHFWNFRDWHWKIYLYLDSYFTSSLPALQLINFILIGGLVKIPSTARKADWEITIKNSHGTTQSTKTIYANEITLVFQNKDILLK